MTGSSDEFVVDFLTLWIVPDWIEQHCLMPSATAEPAPLVMYDWQLWCTVNHYRVKAGALPAGTRKSDGSLVSTAAGFEYRRSQVVAVQKVGKGPWSASIICVEAVGPVVFCGFAAAGDVYRCADHGCGCGWEYEYAAGEPMGVPWTRPLIQILATSEDQVDNVYSPLQTMVRNGVLSEQMRVGEGFIRLPNDGRIDPVTSKANSKLGNPITFAMQDESGLYTATNKLVKTAQTQRRGAAGMGGRSMETTNPWDPAENSTAQQTYESRRPDIFKFYRVPPAGLSYRNKEDRRKIHRFNYRGSLHVDLDSIEAEAAELLETDPAQAERFYGGRLVQGRGAWMLDGLWERTTTPRPEPVAGVEVCGGFDGSDSNDHSGIRLRTFDGYRFTPTYTVGGEQRLCHWDPAQWPGGKIPRGEVMTAFAQLAERYKLLRVYLDPPGWDSEITDLQLLYGDDVFVPWYTRRVQAMHDALERSLTDLAGGRSTHDGCKVTALHVGNARKLAAGRHYILGKPHDHQKIDMAMADVLAWEAGEDARAAGWNQRKKNAGTGRVVVLH